MKTTFLVILLLICNLAFAKARFTEKDKKVFMDSVNKELTVYKAETGGKIDLVVIRPFIFDELMIYHKEEKFTKEEMNKFKADYDSFIKDPSITPANAEASLMKFIEAELSMISNKPLEKTKEGGICNQWGCEEGFKCANDPKQRPDKGARCKVGQGICKEDADCCSGSCIENKLSKKKSCAPIMRCFKPGKAGDSCGENPVCGEGSCDKYDANVVGIGECKSIKNSCKSDIECCSNKCSANRCVENLVCKNCVERGGQPSRGKECCEGLYADPETNSCRPAIEPIIPPQANFSMKKILISLVSVLISNAEAGEAFDTVNANRGKYQYFKVEETETVLKEKKEVGMKFEKRSNFNTCDIRFRDDFYNYLKQENLMDLEIALLAFDYMLRGPGVDDYWVQTKNNPSTSLYSRMKKIAEEHHKIRIEQNKGIETAQRKISCMCIDTIGYDKVKEDKKAYFDKECGEFKDQLSADGLFKDDVNSGDASGIKAKRMMVAWTQSMKDFNVVLTIDNTKTAEAIGNINKWVQGNYKKFTDTEERIYPLSTFTIKNPSGSAAALGAVLGALLAAGIVAILGGFATGSLISAWTAAGIITASAAAGGAGLWLIASLKGAWLNKHPEVYDRFVRSYQCGKKDTCSDYTRELKQPYNTICNIHAGPQSCIKNFFAYYDGEVADEPVYLIDPWVPYGTTKAEIFKGQGNYAEKLEEGFQRALSHMQSVSARGQIGEGYMQQEFINETVAGLFAPMIGTDPTSNYLLNADLVKIIKSKAKAYAIENKFIEETDTENLEKFADYAFDYHYVWPKQSRSKEITFPPFGAELYLDTMSNGVSRTLATGATKATQTFTNLNNKYMEDYLNTLDIYKNQMGTTDLGKLKALNAEIDKTKKELENGKALSALLSNGNLDSQLLNLSANSATQTSGANFSANETAFLNAVGKNRLARKEQIAKLATFKKAIASSNANTKARAEANQKAAASFSKKFNSGLTASINSKGGMGSGTSATDAKTSTFVPGEYGNGGAGLNSGASAYDPNAYMNNGASSGSGKSSTAGSGANGSGDQGAAANGSGAGNDEDSERIADAIDARNKMNKDKFNSNDEQTLFEKITNAYIRNYDKVLNKKKEKADIEKN